MFQVGDRVRNRHFIGNKGFEGTVVAINGKWVHVKHDRGIKRAGAVQAVPPRFDYLADDLEHLNPLLRFAQEL